MTDRILNNFFFTEMKSMNLERRRVESRTDFINHFTCVKTADRLPSVLLFFPLCLSKTHITNFQGHLSENCSPLRLIPSFNLFYFIQTTFSIMSNFIIIATNQFIYRQENQQCTIWNTASFCTRLLKHQKMLCQLKRKKKIVDFSPFHYMYLILIGLIKV